MHGRRKGLRRGVKEDIHSRSVFWVQDLGSQNLHNQENHRARTASEWKWRVLKYVHIALIFIEEYLILTSIKIHNKRSTLKVFVTLCIVTTGDLKMEKNYKTWLCKMKPFGLFCKHMHSNFLFTLLYLLFSFPSFFFIFRCIWN